jgi:hypothetical protein
MDHLASSKWAVIRPHPNRQPPFSREVEHFYCLNDYRLIGRLGCSADAFGVTSRLNAERLGEFR